MERDREEVRGRRERRGRSHRGRQGRSHPRHRPSRLPPGIAGGSSPREGPPHVPGRPSRGACHRDGSQSQQRRALAPRRPRGGPQAGASGSAQQAGQGHDPAGHRLLDRRLRRVRRPWRHRRSGAHLRAQLEPREPPLRGRRGGRQGRGAGPRRGHGPRAHLPRPQADPGRPVEAARQGLPGGRHRGRQGHQDRSVRRVR